MLALPYWPKAQPYSDELKSNLTKSPEQQAAPKPVQEKKAELAKQAQPAQKPAQQVKSNAFADDEEIIIGNLNGKTFGQIKSDPALFEQFKKLCKWTHGRSEERYQDPKQQEQFVKLQKFKID